MTDFYELKRNLLEAEWQAINERHFAERRRKARAKFLCLLGSLFTWAIMAAAVGWIIVPMVAKIVGRG
jgi:hypothetical protein